MGIPMLTYEHSIAIYSLLMINCGIGMHNLILSLVFQIIIFCLEITWKMPVTTKLGLYTKISSINTLVYIYLLIQVRI